MNEVSKNMQEIIVSSNQISDDSKTTDNYIKEISKIVETNQKITNENDEFYTNIENVSNDLKQSVI